MSLGIYVSSGIVIISCIGFMIVGAVYRWDITAEGYGRWTRVVGAVSLVALALAVVGDRLDDLRVAAAALFVGVALAVGFVWVHRLLICDFRLSSTTSWACLSRRTWHPDGRKGKLSATAFSNCLPCRPVSAENFLPKLNSLR